MNSLKTVAGINLVIILVYSALIRLSTGTGNNPGLGIAIMSAYAIVLHVLVCLVVAGAAYLNKSKDMSKSWLLSAGIVLVIGFSVCLGNASL
jgi:hypothetical protein